MKLSLLMVLVAIMAQIKSGLSCGHSPELQSMTRNFGRIIGGTEVKGCSVIPWHVRLHIGKRGDVLCGGSLISDRHVLTGAACLKDVREVDEVKAFLGVHDMQAAFTPLYIKNMTKHPDFDLDSFDSDIAILTLKQPVEGNNPCVKPICLNPDLGFNGKTCIVSGWGVMNKSGAVSSELRMANVQTYYGENCQSEFDITIRDYVKYPDQMICAGLKEGGADACDWDAGGPLVCLDDESYVQVGIASHGYRCALKGFPSVYTRVSYFDKWIKQVMKENSD